MREFFQSLGVESVVQLLTCVLLENQVILVSSGELRRVQGCTEVILYSLTHSLTQNHIVYTYNYGDQTNICWTLIYLPLKSFNLSPFHV